MHRFFSDYAAKVFFIFLVAPCLHGAHNLLLNGSDEATLGYGDTLLVRVMPESEGAEVKILLFADVNGNGTADPDEPLLSKLQIGDGSPFDGDESADGQIESVVDVSQLGYICGDYVLIALDAGIPDTAVFHLLPINSSLTISGTVAIPPDRGGLTVFAARGANDTSAMAAFSDFFGAYTDENGDFNFAVPDEFYGDTFYLLPIDIAGCLQDYVSPELPADTLILTGPVSGLTVSFTPGDNTQISGNIRDEDGNSLPDVSRALFMGATFTLFDTSAYAASIWSSPGYYSRNLKSAWGSLWEIYLDASSMYPHYLTPPPSMALILGSGSSQVDFTVYQADDSISGHVYVNGNPADEIRVFAEGYSGSDTIGSNFTQSYSDGRYTLFVASEADSYRVYVDTLLLPTYATVEPEYQVVPPGASGVDFHITIRVPGDANGDGVVNPVDLIFLANYLYGGGDPPDPLWLGDENCDGSVDNADLMYLGNYLYAGGPAPVPCFPGERWKKSALPLMELLGDLFR